MKLRRSGRARWEGGQTKNPEDSGPGPLVRMACGHGRGRPASHTERAGKSGQAGQISGRQAGKGGLPGWLHRSHGSSRHETAQDVTARARVLWSLSSLCPCHIRDWSRHAHVSGLAEDGVDWVIPVLTQARVPAWRFLPSISPSMTRRPPRNGLSWTSRRSWSKTHARFEPRPARGLPFSGSRRHVPLRENRQMGRRWGEGRQKEERQDCCVPREVAPDGRSCPFYLGRRISGSHRSCKSGRRQISRWTRAAGGLKQNQAPSLAGAGGDGGWERGT